MDELNEEEEDQEIVEKEPQSRGNRHRGATDRLKSSLSILNTFSSIGKNMAVQLAGDLEVVNESQEEVKDDTRVNESEIKILVTNPLNLTERNQENNRDKANVTLSENDESYINLSDLRVNTNERPQYFIDSQPFKK